MGHIQALLSLQVDQKGYSEKATAVALEVGCHMIHKLDIVQRKPVIASNPFADPFDNLYMGSGIVGDTAVCIVCLGIVGFGGMVVVDSIVNTFDTVMAAVGSVRSVGKALGPSGNPMAVLARSILLTDQKSCLESAGLMMV